MSKCQSSVTQPAHVHIVLMRTLMQVQRAFQGTSLQVVNLGHFHLAVLPPHHETFIAANSRRKSWKVMHQILSALGRKWHISLSLTALRLEEVTWPYLIRRELGNLGHQKTSQWGARVSAIDVKWEDWIIQESRGILHRQGTFMLGFEDSLGAGLVMNTEEGLRRLREHHVWGHRGMKELEMSEMPEEE